MQYLKLFSANKAMNFGILEPMFTYMCQWLLHLKDLIICSSPNTFYELCPPM